MSSPESSSTFTDEYLGRALPRIRRFLLVLAAAGLVATLVFARWPVTLGFAAGALISWVNHHWMERAIEALSERITTGQSQERGGVIVLRAALRYVLIAASAYVIFNVSLAGLYGFLGGVFLPFAAIACEAAVEAVFLLRRGN